MRIRLSADTRKCISSGYCVEQASQLFAQDEDEGTVVLLDAQPPEELAEAARNAVAACPVEAITLTEEPGAS